MLNNTKSSTVKNKDLETIIINLYDASCSYVQHRIPDKAGMNRFIETSRSVKDILSTRLLNDEISSSLDLTNKALRRAKDQMIRSYHFRSFVERTIWFDPQKYDDYAFDIAFEIIQKIKTRFIDGYVG